MHSSYPSFKKLFCRGFHDALPRRFLLSMYINYYSLAWGGVMTRKWDCAVYPSITLPL